MKHTPTPWKVNKWQREALVDGFEYVITDSRGHGIVTLNQKGGNLRAKTNADFIVQACDCHEELLEACKTMLRYEWGFKQFFKGTHYAQLQEKADKLSNMLQQAITKAEGKEV